MENKVAYDLIWEGKVRTAKEMFRELGGDFEKCADAFTEDELVKTFDFFNKHTSKEDDEGADEAIWADFIESAQDWLTKKSNCILKRC